MSRFEFDDDHDAGLAFDRRKKTKRPRRWKVLLHNDDYTTMEFVIEVLTRFFHKSEGEATHIMLQVHVRGVGVAGVYSKEMAETKVVEVSEEARTKGMPLMVTTEVA